MYKLYTSESMYLSIYIKQHHLMYIHTQYK